MEEGPLSIEPSSQNVRAVARALAVLNAFAGKSLQSLAEVTQATGLDKGTTRRLLLTLINSGFVAQDPVTQHYRLGCAQFAISPPMSPMTWICAASLCRSCQKSPASCALPPLSRSTPMATSSASIAFTT